MTPRFSRRTIAALTLAWTLIVAPAASGQILESGQRLVSAAAASAFAPEREMVSSNNQAPSLAGRCDGCAPRRVGTAFLQVTYINVFYELANLARGQVTAHITPKTWWTNMKRGWEWDLDDFTVNQIGHPYQGNNYFNAGRANGLNFWESAALTAFGSGTWEYFGETNQASLNDFINTTMGGIALGEMFHRAAWMIRDTRATGSRRLWKEIGAAAVDPVTGYNRFRSGDASRISDKPDEFVPETRGALTSAGVSYRGSNTRLVESTVNPFVEMDLWYGNVREGRSETPYDAFGVRLAFGAGAPLSEAQVRGRLFGRPLPNGAQLSIVQGYQYNKNNAYQFGAQSVDVNLGITKPLSSRTSLWATAWGSVTILGAVDSIPPETAGQLPTDEDDEDAGQGVSTGPRFYDYGPGVNFGGLFNIQRNGRLLFNVSYQANQLHVLDGVRANHLLQRFRTDLNLPLRGRLGVGVTGEVFDRRTFFQVPGLADAHFYFPQFRLGLTWSTS